MSKKQELIQSCQNFYNKIQGAVGDEEVFPKLEAHEIKGCVVSRSSRFDVPSFGYSKKELPKVPHITIRFSGTVPDSAEIFFNGKDETEVFENILRSIDKQKFPEFIESLKDVNKDYSIEVRYGEKVANGGVDWKEPFDTFDCENLTTKIEKILNAIKNALEKRDSNQQFMEKPVKATTAISFAKTNISQASEEELKGIFSILANLLKLTRKIEPKVKTAMFVSEDLSE